MIDEPSRTKARQNGLRSLFLLVILGLSVAGAWSLSRHRGAGTGEAGEILAEIRTRGLSYFWTAQEGTKQWFLIRKEGKVIGWKFTYRKPVPSGGFEGGMVVLHERHPTPPTYKASSQWTLSSDIRQGRYVAYEISLRLAGAGFLRKQEVATQTELKDGQLSVRQKFDSIMMNSSATAPENYLPEGTHFLALQQVARRKIRAIFTGIIDSERPEQTQPRFTRLIVEYVGPAEENPQLSVLRIEQKLTGRSFPSRYCYLDADGRLVKQTIGAIEISAVTRKEILAIYPHAEVQSKGLPE